MASDVPGASSRPSWLLPLLTLLAGTVLGAGLVLLLRPGPDAHGTGPAGGTPIGVAASTGQITVPASCTQGLERARTALHGGSEAADALRRLQTARLQKVLDDLQHAQADVDRLAEQCRRESRTIN